MCYSPQSTWMFFLILLISSVEQIVLYSTRTYNRVILRSLLSSDASSLRGICGDDFFNADHRIEGIALSPLLQGAVLPWTSSQLQSQFLVQDVCPLFVSLRCDVFSRSLITVILAEREDWDTLHNKTFSHRAAKRDTQCSLQVSLPLSLALSLSLCLLSPPGFCLWLSVRVVCHLSLSMLQNALQKNHKALTKAGRLM